LNVVNYNKSAKRTFCFANSKCDYVILFYLIRSNKFMQNPQIFGKKLMSNLIVLSKMQDPDGDFAKKYNLDR